MTDTEEPTFIRVPVDATPRYWDGWAEPADDTLVEDEFGKVHRIIRTIRLGSTGRSDAQYIVDRMASGLHFARVVS